MYERGGICAQCRPPESFLQEVDGSRNTRMTRRGQTMNLIHYPLPKSFRNKDFIGRTVNWNFSLGISLFDLCHDVPLYRCHNDSGRQNCFRRMRGVIMFMLSGESIRFGVLGSRTICDHKVEPSKEK